MGRVRGGQKDMGSKLYQSYSGKLTTYTQPCTDKEDKAVLVLHLLPHLDDHLSSWFFLLLIHICIYICIIQVSILTFMSYVYRCLLAFHVSSLRSTACACHVAKDNVSRQGVE